MKHLLFLALIFPQLASAATEGSYRIKIQQTSKGKPSLDSELFVNSGEEAKFASSAVELTINPDALEVPEGVLIELSHGASGQALLVLPDEPGSFTTRDEKTGEVTTLLITAEEI